MTFLDLPPPHTHLLHPPYFLQRSISHWCLLFYFIFIYFQKREKKSGSFKRRLAIFLTRVPRALFIWFYLIPFQVFPHPVIEIVVSFRRFSFPYGFHTPKLSKSPNLFSDTVGWLIVWLPRLMSAGNLDLINGWPNFKLILPENTTGISGKFMISTD